MASSTDRRFLVDRLLQPQALATAWQWLCACRSDFPYNADIWHLRHHRDTEIAKITRAIRSGRYRFSPMQKIVKADHRSTVLWSSNDALVLKLLSILLQTQLPIHRSCTHIKGNGGHKYAVRQTHNWIKGGAYKYICKTDIKQYYANIDKMQMLHLLSRHIRCPVILDLLNQFLNYSVESGGNFHTPTKGIPRGCSLSPLLAGFHLYELDRDLGSRKGVRYLRFMDDLLVLSQTRWKLRRAIVSMNAWLANAGLKQHPDKTFIGKIKNGFDWLGYQMGCKGIQGPSDRAVKHYQEKRVRLYEQARNSNRSAAKERVKTYEERWLRWLYGGVNCFDRQSTLQIIFDIYVSNYAHRGATKCHHASKHSRSVLL